MHVYRNANWQPFLQIITDELSGELHIHTIKDVVKAVDHMTSTMSCYTYSHLQCRQRYYVSTATDLIKKTILRNFTDANEMPTMSQ